MDLDLDALKSELVRDEGCVLRPYRDSLGVLTVGIGHNLQAKGISQAVCDLMFSEDVAEVVHDLDVHLPFWRHLDPVRQRVMVNLCFNVGIGSLLGFKHTLAMIEAGSYVAAADGLAASLWHTQVGPRAARLEQMMRTGEPVP